MIRFLAILTLAAGQALAWGPFTHAALSEALLERIGEERGHSLAFLRNEPYRTIFVSSSLSPDMTLSAFAGRKVDPAYNKLFHDRPIGKAMIQATWDAQDWKGAAFALGWHGHAIADRSMSRAGGIIYKDLFGLPKNVRKQLGSTFTAIIKVSLDAIALTEYGAPEVAPHVDEAALVAALKGPIARRKLSVEAPDAAIPSYRSSFAWSCSSLHSFCSRLGETKRAFPDLVNELTEPLEPRSRHELLRSRVPDEGERSIPGFDEALDAMETALTGALGERPPPPPEIVQAAEATPDQPGLGTRAVRRAKALAASGGEFLWSGTSITRRLRESIVDRSLQMVNFLGGDGSLGSRLLVTFAGDMLNDTKTWPAVRAHIQKMATPASPSITDSNRRASK